MSRFRRGDGETVFRNRWLQVRSHAVKDDEGRAGDLRVVTFEMPEWVNVVAFTNDDHLICVRQYRFGIEADSLEIPGGLIDPGETPQQAAIRELREETGYTGRSWRSAGWCYPNPALQGNRLHTFVAEGCDRVGSQSLDDLEDCRVELVPVGEIREKIARREFSHALVLVALLEELSSASRAR